jgi:hypothetical protein
MSDAAQAFARALAEEREAAARVDFVALMRLQDEKRALLPLLKESADPALVYELGEAARKNLRLLKHLLSCLQGALGEPASAATYTANGQNVQPLPGTQPGMRGRL